MEQENDDGINFKDEYERFMNNLTPANRAYSSGIYNINALKDFPLLIFCKIII